jgi:hypothetical protein
MSLTTLSSIYYGFTVNNNNKFIDFKEGATTYQAVLTIGTYSLAQVLVEIKRAMEAAGALTYTVSVNRTTRIVTIASTSTISLLISTGAAAASSFYSSIGFTGSDLTGASSYSSNLAAGSSYVPQFILQDHVSSDDWNEAIDARINESSNGTLEVVSFGTRRILQFQIMYATNLNIASGRIVYNASGVANLRSLMSFLVTKSPVEFMPNKDNPTTYETIILDSTEADSRGVGFRLIEMYDRNLPGFFRTGILKFRSI